MIFEGFLINLASALGIPMGAKLRKANYLNKSSTGDSDLEALLEDDAVKDFLNSIIDIAKDDVCVGDEPMFYQSDKARVPASVKEACKGVCEAFNFIAPWVAFDLLKTGKSIYTYSVVEGSVYFNPYLKETRVYLQPDHNLLVVDDETNLQIENAVAFVYYDKNMLELVEDEDTLDDELKGQVAFVVNPSGIMTKNAKTAIKDLIDCERDVKNLRASTSRVVRFATVEVGLNKGDVQQQLVDDISEGLNANSRDMVSSPEFDDQIPVYPVRKGLGKPEYEEHLPSADLSQLSDLDYFLSKYFLSLRFPKSYSDFTTNLQASAASMIRGDVRYAKLLVAARSCIEKTFNKFMSGVKEIGQHKIKFALTQVPSTEDDDLVATLSNFNDFASSALSVIVEAETKDEALARIEALRVLYRTSTNSEGVEAWNDKLMKVVDAKFAGVERDDFEGGEFEEEGSGEGVEPGMDTSDVDLGMEESAE